MVSRPINKSWVLLICFWFATGCALFQKMPPAPPPAKKVSVEFPAAVTLLGPNSRINLESRALRVAGGAQLGGIGPHYGFKPNGKLDVKCEGKPGIATESPTPSKNLGQGTGQAMADCGSGTCVYARGVKSITGSGGKSPDMVHGQTELTWAAAHKFWERLTQPGAPTRTLEKPEVGSKSASFGSAKSPAIIHFLDKARFQGRVSGTGVLIVDGDLVILGELKWQGIVLVGACNHCNGLLKGTGNFEVTGALVLNKDLDTTGLFTGSATIRYSCKSINLALKRLNSSGHAS